MSCSYADGLSPYENKGVLGLPEKFDSPEELMEKCNTLAEWIKRSKFVIVHTGAGISTSAGIPDFRGPNGVWTLERKGLKPNINVSFCDAKPTKTHMALKKLVDEKLIHYVVSQNIDGLHLKSGLKRKYLAELHGNMFIEQCNVCKRQFVRSTQAPTVGQKCIGVSCYSSKLSGRPCRGKLHDVILDWEHSLPDGDLDMADLSSCVADLSICFGTTLQIVPSGNLPLNTLRYGGKLVVCNLQPTKHDNKADLIINSYVDDVLENVMTNLGLVIPEYDSADDPTKSSNICEWTICKKQLKDLKVLYKKQCDGVPKKRVLVKKQQDSLPKCDNKKIKLENKVSIVKSVTSSDISSNKLIKKEQIIENDEHASENNDTNGNVKPSGIDTGDNEVVKKEIKNESDNILVLVNVTKNNEGKNEIKSELEIEDVCNDKNVANMKKNP